ncbi:MAG: Gfo/Idh/MocA family oxidoreductase [Chryseolinea sp.]
MHFIEGPVKWGIIGCGDVCEVKSGPAFGKVEGSSLEAVMRRDASKAADFAKRHHVRLSYADAGMLIDNPQVNAIYIATPPESHEKYAIEAMRAGKPVYIEKPVSTSSASCKRILEASSKFQIPCVVAHYRRELELFKRIRKMVVSGAIGKVRLITLNLYHPPKVEGISENWRVDPSLSGGSLLYDLGPHQLDILFWIFGTPHSVNTSSINQGKYYTAADITSITAVFDKDIFFQGVWSFNIPAHEKRDSCKIIGESGSLEFPFFSSFTSAKLVVNQNGAASIEEFTFPAHIQEPMIQQVVRYFQGHRGNPCGLDEALVTLQMIEKSQTLVNA